MVNRHRAFAFGHEVEHVHQGQDSGYVRDRKEQGESVVSFFLIPSTASAYGNQREEPKEKGLAKQGTEDLDQPSTFSECPLTIMDLTIKSV